MCRALALLIFRDTEDGAMSAYIGYKQKGPVFWKGGSCVIVAFAASFRVSVDDSLGLHRLECYAY